MFRPASRKQILARVAIYGPNISEVTQAAMSFARGLGVETFAVIDTVGGDSEHFADRFTFNVDVLTDKSCAGVIKALECAEADEAKVVVVVDGSVPWRELMDFVDQKKSKGSVTAWAEANPIHKQMLDAIRNFAGHVVVAFRAEVTAVVDRESERSFVRRLPTRPEQGKGIENEFPFVLRVDEGGAWTVEKDTAGSMQGSQGDVVAINALAAAVAAVLRTGEPTPTAAQRDEIRHLCLANRMNTPAFLQLVGGCLPDTAAAADKAILALQRVLEGKLAQGAAATPPQPTRAPASRPEPPVEVPAPSPPPSPPPTPPAAPPPPPPPAPKAPQESIKPTATETLLAFKKATDAVSTSAELAVVIADWRERTEALPKRQRHTADRYGSARLAEITGVDLDEEQAAVKDVLRVMANKAGA
jgi:AAA domain